MWLLMNQIQNIRADSLYAQYIYKGVMTEILPYLNIFQDEEVTDKANAKMTYLKI